MKAKKEARGKKADWWENGLWSEKARPVCVCAGGYWVRAKRCDKLNGALWPFGTASVRSDSNTRHG